MIPISAKTLLDGLWPVAPETLMLTDVVTDSREVKDGCVFVAIKGERVDGHDYAAQAVAQGAAVVVMQKALAEVPQEKSVLVGDPLDAMIAMGANYRGLFSPLVLGITGSVGKTSTKEFCATVFSSFGETLKTEGNQNNEIGMPKTLLRLNDSVRYAVVEMGAQKLGDIHKLSVAAAPTAAAITKIGTSHIATMGSIENILSAKLEICDGLPAGAPLLMNGDDELLWGASVPERLHTVYVGIENEDCAVRAKNIRAEGDGQYFAIADMQFGAYEAYISAPGRHNVYNALLAYAAATRLGLAPAQAAVALSGYRPLALRQNLLDVQGMRLIEDCYNASPESVQAALRMLGEMPVQGKRIAVLGDMLELGDTGPVAHQTLAQQCQEAGVSVLLTVGPLAALAAEEAKRLNMYAKAFDTNEAAAEALLEQAMPGDAILVKASRGMKFEEILERFKQNYDVHE